jgi:hypothetical protein
MHIVFLTISLIFQSKRYKREKSRFEQLQKFNLHNKKSETAIIRPIQWV